MNLLTAAAMAGVGVMAWLFGRSLVFPPVAFAGVWAGALVILALAGDALYPIHDTTRLVYFLGVVGFAAGSLVAHTLAVRLARTPVPVGERLAPARVARVLDLFIVALVVGLPFYWRELQEALRLTTASTLLQAARWRDVQAQEGLVPQIPRLLGNMIQLSIPMTLVAVSMAQRLLGWRVRVLVLFALALLYQVMTGGRVGAAALVFGTVGIVWLVAGRVPLSRVIPALIAFVLVFELIAIQLEKGLIRRGLTLEQNLPAMIVDFRAYLVGGVVGFDRVVEHPGEVPSTGGLLRTVKIMANRAGLARYDLPSLHAQYSTLADGVSGNVYTAYFQYLPEFGLGMTMILVGMIGAAATLAFHWARGGSLAGRVFFGIMFVGILQSVFIEGFYTNVNLLAKTALLLGLLHVTCRTPRRPAAAAP